MIYSESFAQEFWSHINRDGDCWPWLNAKNEGYGVLHRRGIRNRPLSAHQVAWILASGAEIPAGLLVCHTCDLRSCARNDEQGVYVVNGKELPRWGHLFLGTNADNLADMAAKGRSTIGRSHDHAVKGERVYNAKLTSVSVLAIRSRFDAGEKGSDLALEFGISRSHVSGLVHGTKWGWLR